MWIPPGRGLKPWSCALRFGDNWVQPIEGVFVRLSIIGCGHVGLTTAACLAHVGHDVLGVDDDLEKVASISRGDVPFHEPGLLELVREGLAAGRLRFSADSAEAARFGQVVFVCVGTPTLSSGAADLSQVEGVARDVARNLEGYTVIAEKSTVPVETGRWVADLIAEGAPPGGEFDLASNPEFLREVYRPILDRTGCHFIATDIATAELIKHSCNAFLATKISFINSVADICERTGANVTDVAHAMGLDSRIGSSFLSAGIGFGGECLPKDVRAYRYKASELGVPLGILEAVEKVNEERVARFVDKIRGVVGELSGRRIAVWGLAFKPDTDDLRHAPALEVVRRLVDAGAEVMVHDPAATAAAKGVLGGVDFASDPYEAATGADCVAVCTEWPAFASVDLERLRGIMARPVVVDGRNVFRPGEMAAAGFTYASIGRPTVGARPSRHAP
jgi:UDPglucose 6-dehydrogenase